MGALGAREASRDIEMVTTGPTGRGQGQASGTHNGLVGSHDAPPPEESPGLRPRRPELGGRR